MQTEFKEPIQIIICTDKSSPSDNCTPSPSFKGITSGTELMEPGNNSMIMKLPF